MRERPILFEEGPSTYLKRQRGARATRAIPTGTLLGIFCPPPVALDGGRSLQPGSVLWFDGADAADAKVGYDIRDSLLYALNHACEPNCEVRHVEGGRVALFALSPLAAGAELHIDYVAGSDALFPKLWFKCRCHACERRALHVRNTVLVMISAPPLIFLAAFHARAFGTLLALACACAWQLLRRRSAGAQDVPASASEIAPPTPRDLPANDAPGAPDVCPTARASARARASTTLFESRPAEPSQPRVFRVPVLLAIPPDDAAVGDEPRQTALLAFAERRESVRDWGRIDVVVRRSDDGGASWGPLKLAVDESELDFEDEAVGAALRARGALSVGNPCPAWERASRTAWLLVTVSCADDNEAAIISRAARDTRRVFAARSTDAGRTWSRAREVTSNVKRPDWTWYATGPGGAVQLAADSSCAPGRLVFPCNHASTTADGFVRRRAHVLYADGADGGALALRLGGSVDAPFTNECALAQASGGGALLLNARDMSGRCQRWAARSEDGGVSWLSAAQHAELPEPAMHGCHAALARCAGPRARLAFANPASSRRERLTVRWSADDGSSWAPADRVVLHAGPAAYCSMQPLPPSEGEPSAEGPLAVLYECGAREPYERIAFALARCGDADDAGCEGDGEVRDDPRCAASGGADGMHGAWG